MSMVLILLVGCKKRRGYILWIAQSRNRTGMSSSSDISEKGWKIWSIQCPNKMKIVIWRLAHDCLPSGTQLRKRTIPSDYSCYFCSRDESMDHTFLLCQFAKEIWEEIKSTSGMSLNLQGFCNIKQWVLEWLCTAKPENSTVFAVPFGTFGKSGMMCVMVNLLPIPKELWKKSKPMWR